MQWPNNPEFAPFFENAAEGRLTFPRCRACERFHWYPLKRCPHCQDPRIEWVKVGGEGRLWSWTEVRHRFSAARRPPYIVALVEFDDAPGLRLVTNLVRVSTTPLRIDLPVRPVWPKTARDPIVNFEPVPVRAAPQGVVSIR